ncbi:metal ABC transporter solute-binding protein, Zn/Mn family [Sphaerisporangium corydalis]|uniref:Metal ABC transporter solute-binding protein, Zn/Mn family n=1 Tax=Sphaerisporangium corydalis TaxID=1441875 RepID=A0ABV9EQF8_9ACTN|nr:zinc ABC transporter substrate-binding protein [Sphaerisporangium corydalis]
MRHPLPPALAGLALLALTSCASPAANPAAASATGSAPPVGVVASTDVYGDIARQVGGDRVAVTSFVTDPAQDPHSYEAGTRDRLALSKARVVIENGGGYDDFVDTLLKAAGNGPAVLLNAVTISGRTAPPGEELNEHVWYDLPAMGRLADRISAALGTVDPAGAATYAAGAKAFRLRLRPLVDQEAALARTSGGAAVAVTEPVPLYMLRAAGLRNATPPAFSEAVEEGDDVSPSVLRETLALFGGGRVKALVYNEQTAGPETEQVRRAATDAGVPVVPVTETLPAGQDYIGWMTANLAALRTALGR